VKTISDPAIASVLAARLERLTPEQNREWGTISPHQMLAHLADAADAVMQRRPFPRASRAPSRLLKYAALYLPRPWPHGIQAGARPAEVILDAGAFATERKRSLAAMSELAAADAQLAPEHPLFGSMTRGDWLRWTFLHTDHHLRQFGL
jgi:hypothetical protein